MELCAKTRLDRFYNAFFVEYREYKNDPHPVYYKRMLTPNKYSVFNGRDFSREKSVRPGRVVRGCIDNCAIMNVKSE